MSPDSIVSCPELFPCCWNPCAAGLQGKYPTQETVAEIQGNLVLHISQYKHFQQFFILGKFRISGFLSWLQSLTLPHLTPRCFCCWLFFPGQPSWYPELWSLFLSGRAQARKCLDGLKFLLRWPQHFCREIVLSWSASSIGQLIALQRGKAFTHTQWPKTYARPIDTKCRCRIRIPVIKRQRICIPFF